MSLFCPQSAVVLLASMAPSVVLHAQLVAMSARTGSLHILVVLFSCCEGAPGWMNTSAVLGQAACLEIVPPVRGVCMHVWSYPPLVASFPGHSCEISMAWE